MRIRSRLGAPTPLLVLLGALLCAGVAAGDDAVRITAANAGDYKALLPEPVYARVVAGQYVLPVVPVDAARFRANYSDRFWQASQANRGKYGIDPETGGLTDVATGRIPTHFFGLPFPDIDPTGSARRRQDRPQLPRPPHADGRRLPHLRPQRRRARRRGAAQRAHPAVAAVLRRHHRRAAGDAARQHRVAPARRRPGAQGSRGRRRAHLADQRLDHLGSGVGLPAHHPPRPPGAQLDPRRPHPRLRGAGRRRRLLRQQDQLLQLEAGTRRRGHRPARQRHALRPLAHSPSRPAARS